MCVEAEKGILFCFSDELPLFSREKQKLKRNDDPTEFKTDKKRQRKCKFMKT